MLFSLKPLTNVQFNRKKITYLAPCPGDLPSSGSTILPAIVRRSQPNDYDVGRTNMHLSLLLYDLMDCELELPRFHRDIDCAFVNRLKLRCLSNLGVAKKRLATTFFISSHQVV
ncbi:hypothetical protein ACLOJK_034564 [Asimina triloba]